MDSSPSVSAQHPGGRRKSEDPATETVLDAPRHGCGVRRTETAHELGSRHRPGQFEQGQRIAPGLRRDPLHDFLVQRHVQSGVQQGTGVARAEPSQHHLLQPAQTTIGMGSGEHETEGLRTDAVRHERQRLGRTRIEPLGVVDHTYQRLAGRRLGQQAQYGQAQHEAVGHRSCPQPKCRSQGVLLRSGQVLQCRQERRADLVQHPEGQLRLRFHTGGPHHAEADRSRSHVVEQRGLADTRLTENHKSATSTGLDGILPSVEQRTFSTPTQENRGTPRQHHVSNLAAASSPHLSDLGLSCRTQPVAEPGRARGRCGTVAGGKTVGNDAVRVRVETFAEQVPTPSRPSGPGRPSRPAWSTCC